MILNQGQLSTRDVASGTRAFLNKSKTSFDIASLVSSEPGESPKQMSPLDSLSPDDRFAKTSKENKFRFDTRWHPYFDNKNFENGIDSGSLDYKKFNRHQGNKDYRRRVSSSSSSISPKLTAKFDTSEVTSPSVATPSFVSHDKSSFFDVSTSSVLPSSNLHIYMHDSQLLKAMASGSLHFPFPPLNSMKPFSSLLPTGQETENMGRSIISPRVSPSQVPTQKIDSSGVLTSTAEHSRSGTSPKIPACQTPQTPDFGTKSTSSSTPQSPLFSSTNSDIEMTRQALLQAAANPGFSHSNPIPGIPGPFMGSCFPRIPNNSALGTIPFDSASNFAMRNPFCPPNTAGQAYQPWLFRQAAAAAASVRPFPPQLAGELVCAVIKSCD